MSAIRKRIPTPDIREPLLRLVDRAAVRSESRRRLIVTLSIGSVVIALFAVALIQARLVQTQRDVDGLYAQIEEVEATRAQLANEVVHAESPEGIIARAIELGMVNAEQPIHLEAVRAPRVRTEETEEAEETEGGEAEVVVTEARPTEDGQTEDGEPEVNLTQDGVPKDGATDPATGGGNSLDDVLDPLPSEGESK